MIEKLPLEILLIIADLLEARDKKTCSLVCRLWKDIFQKNLWKVVKISRSSWVDSLERGVSKYTLKENHNRVHSIEINNYMCRTNSAICKLINLFPGVKYFSYSASRGRIWSLSMTNLSGWKSLTHLSLKFGLRNIPTITEELFKSLSVLPALVNLTINQKPPFSSNTFITWRHIDQLHSHLPRLKYLKCQMNLQKINPSEITELRNIKPAESLRTADYSAPRLDMQWIIYLALKYPKLVTLYLTVEKRRDLSERAARSKTMILPPGLPYFFPCLKNIYTASKSTKGLEFSALYSQLFKSSVKLEKIETSLFTNPPGTKLPANQTACAQLFSATLKSLQVGRCYKEHSNLKYSLTDLGTVEFSSLVYLNILCARMFLKIDNVLNVCPSLKKLEITSPSIDVNKQKTTSTFKHGLRHLRLVNTTIKPLCFEYISDSCRQLKYLSLKDVEIRNPDSENNTCLYLNMPFTQLMTLSLSNVRLCNYPSFIFSSQYGRKFNDSAQNEEVCFTEVYLNYSRNNTKNCNYYSK
ncbi:hypothetical protein F4703DRAFT_1852294 [Phycomyces blakesleeanus]